MARLTRDDFRIPTGHVIKDVEVAEFGTVGIKTLTSNECLEYQKLLMKGVDKISQNYQVELVALCLVDENGQRLFSSKEDLNDLAIQPARIIGEIWNAAMELNGLSKGASEEVAKNSEKTDTDVSNSG